MSASGHARHEIVVKRDARTRQIHVPLTPTQQHHAASKDYVDNALISAIDTTQSGAGEYPFAIDPTSRLHRITSDATGNALTLAAGTQGHMMTIIYVAEAAGADTAILTPASLAGGTTITFNGLGDAVEIIYDTTVGAWYVLGGSAVVA
jgi:hypothetical protein